MKFNIKNLSLGVMSAFALCVMAVPQSTHAQATTGTDVLLTLTGGTITIGATGQVDLGTFTVGSADIDVDRQFQASGDEYFYVEDLLGDDAGYDTTIQASNLDHTTLGPAINIPAANVFMRFDVAGGPIATLAGTANPDVDGGALTTTYTALDTPITFINRSTGVNSGRTGKYGLLPWLRVTIPAFQSVGSYQGTLTMTLLP